MEPIIIAGHACVDLTPSLPDGALQVSPGTLLEVGPLSMSAGGSVINTGLAIASLGVPVRAVATLGDDVLASIVHDTAAAAGLLAEFVEVPGGVTSHSIVLEQSGLSRSFWHHIGAAGKFTGNEVEVRDAPLVHVGYPSVLPALVEKHGRRMLELLRRIDAAGASSSIDLAVVDRTSPHGQPNWIAIMSRWSPLIDVLTPSIDDLRSIGLARGSTARDLETAAASLVEAGVGIALVSAGERGAYLRTGSADRLARGGRAIASLDERWVGRSEWIPAQRVEAIRSTNGAGDASTAGFLAGLLANYDPVDAARLGAEVAAERLAAPAANGPYSALRGPRA